MKKTLSIFVTVAMLVICLFGCTPAIDTVDVPTTTPEIVISDEVKELADDTKNDIENGENIETDDISGVVASAEEESTLENEEALEIDGVVEQENISWDGTNTGKGTNLLGACTGKIYFSQADSRWANSLYTSTNNKTQTMKSSGCGPTCAAMIVSSSKGAITPLTMGNIFVDNGYRTRDNGTAWSCWPFVADYFDFNYYEATTSFAKVEKYLETDNNKDGVSDYFVVASVSYGLFTTGGHYIVLFGDTNDILEIGDPYLYSGKFDTASRKAAGAKIVGNTTYVSEAMFKKYGNAVQYWVFSNDYVAKKPVVTTKKKETTTSAPKTTTSSKKTMYVNTKKDPLNVRYSPNGTIVGSLSRGSKVDVYETKNGWSRIGTNRWVSSTYLSTTKPSTSTIVTYKTTVGKRYRLKYDTILYSNGNLTGTKYEYLKYTEIEVLQHYSTNVDKIKVIKTGRIANCKVSDFI